MVTQIYVAVPAQGGKRRRFLFFPPSVHVALVQWLYYVHISHENRGIGHEIG